MKNKYLIVIVIVSYLLFLVGCSADESEEKVNTPNICGVDGCNYTCKFSLGIYEDYCSTHLCEEEYCGMCKEDGSDFCWLHKIDQITLTESQIKDVRKVVDDYISNLMEKQSNILAVNIFNNTPKTDDYYIKYSCNVVREDSNVNFATIYVYITDEGEYKVDELKYDDK